MTRMSTVGRILAALLLGATGAAVAADQQVLGRKLLIRNPTGAEADRVVVILGRSHPTSLTLVGDPTLSGASLQVVANGANGTTELLTLDAAGWTATATGFNYSGPTTGDPVRRVILKRTAGGVAVLKAVLRGTTGTTDLTVTPPNPGDDGGLVLALGGGDRYCVSFGGAAGGTETNDDANSWRIVKATGAAGCPSSPSITTTSTSTSTSSTIATACGSSAPACNGSCPVDYHCESFTSGGCICVTGGSNECAVCDTPCTGGDVCRGAVDPSDPPNYLATCECVTPPVCDTGVCGGGCPTGASCVMLSPGTSCGCYFVP